jgi:hypothetical protein
VKLRIVPISDRDGFKPLAFTFDIAMGVRKRDDQLRAQLDEVLERDRGKIDALLDSYGVPRAP